ncbi:thiamine phosphate synthase [Aestuariibaculum sediminum]|uniref:Thiamine phosphate synthase n=1 Tax=Aestuariibaculum sediminum TaxID=2770637 RepID=A0A8J6Q5Y8_9FLAO|nr:thiamine phosphate synthase [Aestuariibaculum sediminum]MBD0831273.1 thiamine phosphate synthase [Aestuariibaculum sediminum]
MIIVIAPEHDIKNEIVILHELFHEGLQYYHLRKPHKTYTAYEVYLNQIDSKFHNRVVVHQSHKLLDDYNLKGLHFQETKRRTLTLDTFQNLRDNSTITISSSFHSPNELTNCKFNFDYYFLSPVFSSISKQGYEGQEFNVNHINKTVIGMGGVTTKNLTVFDKLGYKGIGVLGSIWNSETPVEDFKIMQKHYKN